jgi:ATP-dependent Clp protease adaptor protein ClpS
MIDTVAKPKTRIKVKTERPRLHKVILVNDDYTPREFVVTVLKAEFHMTEDEACKVMITAHRHGVCVVAVFAKDVAETKATRATEAGRAKGYLRCYSPPSPRNSGRLRSSRVGFLKLFVG